MRMPKITYYEEEIYSDWFDLNSCNNYKELMKKFMQDESYMGRMGRWKTPKEIKKRPPYSDPDCEHLQSCSYYWELTQFLNHREKYMKDEKKGEFGKFVYIAPSNCKKDDGQDEAVHGVEGKITVLRRSSNTCELDIYLKSDQFSFSVGNFDNTHPYGILYRIAKQQDDEKLYKFIADCINDTRTLGGGFLWPEGIWKGYNTRRGGGNPFDDVDGKYLGEKYSRYYIEDRVDLTLLEIKYLFDWIKEHEKKDIWEYYSNKGIIIFNEVIKNDKKGIEWLRHFGSFDNYIEFFCFDDFMKDGMPLDIETSELELSEDGMKVEGKKNPLKDSTEYMHREKRSIYRLFNPKTKNNWKKIKKILNNVRILTIARSNRMQTFVDQYRKKNKVQSSIF